MSLSSVRKIKDTTNYRSKGNHKNQSWNLLFIFFLTSGVKKMLSKLVMTKKMDAITLEDKNKIKS